MSQAALSQDHCNLSRRSWIGCCRFSVLLLLQCALANSGAGAAEQGFRLGDTLPAFSKMTAVDRSEYNIDQFAKWKVLIVAFTCNRCPYAVDYEQRLNLLQKKYGDSNSPVKLLVINSNNGPDESLQRMADRAREQHFEFTYVKDSDQAVARTLGAIYTPEFFVFDQERRLVYKGALDDSTNADDVTLHYVNASVAAVLAGTPIKTAEAGARGCTIRFKRRRPVRRTP